MCILIIDNTPTLVAYVGDVGNLSRFHFTGTTPASQVKKRRIHKGAAPKKTEATQAARNIENESTSVVIGSVERTSFETPENYCKRHYRFRGGSHRNGGRKPRRHVKFLRHQILQINQEI